MQNEIRIEGFSFDLSMLIKQLRQELDNDWFTDSIGYIDYLDPKYLQEIFKPYFNSPKKAYLPGAAQQYNIPKKGFTLRYSLESSFMDRMVYHAFGTLLIDAYDEHLSDSVLSYRRNPLGTDRYLYTNKRDAWLKFESKAKSLFKPGTFIVVADIQNYFETIRIGELERVLEFFACKMASKKNAERMGKANQVILRLLKKWAVKGTQGIPQNRDASSFIGNLFLHKLDLAMADKRYNYFRFMDDIKIVCPTLYHARKTLKDLILELRKLGLTINSQKSFISEYGDAKSKDAFKETHEIIDRIDSLWKTRRWPKIEKTLPMLQDFLIEQIKKKKTKEAEFSFCLLRLKKIAGCKETRKAFDFSVLNNYLIREFEDHPDLCDHFINYFKHVLISDTNLEALSQIVCQSERRIYSWQCFLLWQLFVLKKFKTQPLIKASRQIIEERRENPLFAGALLYLGALGGAEDKRGIAKNFKYYKTFLSQRCALIAIHELEHADEIEPNVDEYVLDHLEGTLERLSNSFRGTYSTPPEDISVRDICRDLTPYTM